MEGSQKSELCSKCGEYLIPNIYHECKNYGYIAIFEGIIKNKSELKKIMQMLGI